MNYNFFFLISDIHNKMLNCCLLTVDLRAPSGSWSAPAAGRCKLEIGVWHLLRDLSLLVRVATLHDRLRKIDKILQVIVLDIQGDFNMSSKKIIVNGGV